VDPFSFSGQPRGVVRRPSCIEAATEAGSASKVISAMTARRPRPISTALVALTLATTGIATNASPAAAVPYCGIVWGSSPRDSHRGAGGGWVSQVRSGRHGCFDRLVVDIGDGAGLDWYDVRYVDEVRTGGEGAVVPTRGGASLRIAVLATAASPYGIYPGIGTNPTELTDVSGSRTFRQVVWAGDFESTSTIGIGTRARLPFRVFTLPGPRGDVRLIIDVAHAW
jgi:hypothetical protein